MSENCIIRFNRSLNSEYTQKNYLSHISKFKEYLKLKSYDELLKIDVNKLQEHVEEYLFMLKSTTNPNSIPTLFLGIQHFFIINRILLNWSIVKKMYPPKILRSGCTAWTKSEINAISDATTSMRDRLLIYFLATTGVRIGLFDHEMRIKHTAAMPKNWLAIKIYPGTINEYWAFLPPYVNDMLRRYFMCRINNGELIHANTPLFRNIHTKLTVKNVKQLQWSGARTVIYRAVTSSGVGRTKIGSRYNIQINHGFRKYFNTTLKLNNNVNPNIVEKLMGHKNGLDGTYLTPTLFQCFDEIQKAHDDLIL